MVFWTKGWISKVACACAVLAMNGCGRDSVAERGASGGGSNLLDLRSTLFSDQYEFLQLMPDGSYTAGLFHGDSDAGHWAKLNGDKQVNLTEASSGKVEMRTFAPTLNLKPFLDQPCRTTWKPAAGDGTIAYRTLTLKNDGTYSATAGEGSVEVSGTWVTGYTAYAKRMTCSDGKTSYLAMLGNAIQFK